MSSSIGIRSSLMGRPDSRSSQLSISSSNCSNRMDGAGIGATLRAQLGGEPAEKGILPLIVVLGNYAEYTAEKSRPWMRNDVRR
jgi:hypothetical protein